MSNVRIRIGDELITVDESTYRNYAKASSQTAQQGAAIERRLLAMQKKGNLYQQAVRDAAKLASGFRHHDVPPGGTRPTFEAYMRGAAGLDPERDLFAGPDDDDGHYQAPTGPRTLVPSGRVFPRGGFRRG